MSDQVSNPTRVPKLGDRVQILHYPGMKGRIIELRGAIGAGGRELYRVKLTNQPKPAYVEVPADQLIFLDDEN
jgi:hypothetical protein